MSLLKRIGTAALGVGIYALSSVGPMVTDANASVSSQDLNSKAQISYKVKSGDVLSKIVPELNKNGKLFEPLGNLERVAENIVNEGFVDNFNPETALNGDVQANRNLVSNLTGDQYHQLREFVEGADLDNKLGITRGVHSITPDQEMDNYASMYQVFREVSSKTGVSIERLYAHVDKESKGDVWTSSGTGPRGAPQLSEFLCRENQNFENSGFVNPFNLEESLLRAAEYISILDGKFADEVETLAYHQGAGKVNRAVNFARVHFNVDHPTLDQVLAYPGGEYVNTRGKTITEGPFDPAAIEYVPGVKKREVRFAKDLSKIIGLAEAKYSTPETQLAINSISDNELVRSIFGNDSPNSILVSMSNNIESLRFENSPLISSFSLESILPDGTLRFVLNLERTFQDEDLDLAQIKATNRKKKNEGCSQKQTLSKLDVIEPKKVVFQLPDIAKNSVTPYGSMSQKLKKRYLKRQTIRQKRA